MMEHRAEETNEEGCQGEGCQGHGFTFTFIVMCATLGCSLLFLRCIFIVLLCILTCLATFFLHHCDCSCYCFLESAALLDIVLRSMEYLTSFFVLPCSAMSRGACTQLTLDVLLSLNTRDTTLPITCLLYTSPSPRDRQKSRMPSSA